MSYKCCICYEEDKPIVDCPCNAWRMTCECEYHPKGTYICRPCWLRDVVEEE